MQKPRLNHQIKAQEVRVTEPPHGILTHGQAMLLAGELDGDLIEISPNAKPPVCVIMEYGKWKYEQAKKVVKHTVLDVKQIQIRPVTDVGDMANKARQANEFLAKGHKVRLVVRLRGRELAHETEAQEALDRLIAMCDCVVEQRSGLEARQIIALVRKK